MRIAHLSDFHYTSLNFNPFRLFSKRILATANWLIQRRKEFCYTQLKSLPDLFSSLKVDLVLLGGDFSSSSLKEEFESMQGFVGKIGKPWIAIPGNHDQYTSRSYKHRRFYRYFSNATASASHSLSKDSMESYEILPGWHIISLDTARPTSFISSEGIFTESLEQALEYRLQKIPKEDKIILFNHYPFFPQKDPKRSLRRSNSLERILRNYSNICLYLHGHSHRHSIADLQPEGLPITADSGSCTFSKGGTWNLIETHPTGCSIETFQFVKEWKSTKRQEFLWNR